MNLDKLMKELDEKINAIHEEGTNKLHEQLKVEDYEEEEITETKHINIWSSKKKDTCHFLYTIEDLILYINSSNNIDILIQDNSKTDDPLCRLDYNLSKNIKVTYTDKEYPITIINHNRRTEKILINTNFYNTHKEAIKKIITSKLLEKIANNPPYISVPDFIVDENFINEFILSDKLEGISIYIQKILGINFNNKDIEKLQKAYRNVHYDNNEISSDRVIETYTMKGIKESNNISLTTNLSEKDLENFKYIDNNKVIFINPNERFYIKINIESHYNEREYFEKIKNILNVINTHNKSYTIGIKVRNRELFEQSNIIKLYPNINFIIDNDLHRYTLDEYLKEEEKLNLLVKPIKESNLSPYEKFIAVYNIVKQFKPYKENDEKPEEARYLRHILNNEFIVCVGFQTLLETLLHKVGIPVMEIGVKVDNEYKENKGSNLSGHARNIVKIDDNKYNIHGIYITDATWDNSMNFDLYRFINLTFDETKEGRHIEKLESFDLLLDFHNPKEFSEKINFYIKNEIHSNKRPKTEIEKITRAYEYLFYDILYILEKLDYDKYIYFFNKYNNDISKLIEKIEISEMLSQPNNNLKDLDNLFSEFLTEYLKYIIPLSNNKIDNKILYEAIKEVKRVIKNYDENTINKEFEESKEIQEQIKEKIFPYSYNPNNEIPNYLDTKKR